MIQVKNPEKFRTFQRGLEQPEIIPEKTGTVRLPTELLLARSIDSAGFALGIQKFPEKSREI